MEKKILIAIVTCLLLSCSSKKDHPIVLPVFINHKFPSFISGSFVENSNPQTSGATSYSFIWSGNDHEFGVSKKIPINFKPNLPLNKQYYFKVTQLKNGSVLTLSAGNKNQWVYDFFDTRCRNCFKTISTGE